MPHIRAFAQLASELGHALSVDFSASFSGYASTGVEQLTMTLAPTYG